MRRIQWMVLCGGIFMTGLCALPAAAQPGHAPFVYATNEIDDFERTLAPAGIAGATIQSPGVSAALSHRAVVQAGNVAIPYVTGAPLFLESAHTAYSQFGGILGTTDGGAPTGSNYNDIFPGGWGVTSGPHNNGGNTRNFPSATASYNGTKISLVTNTDANTADDVGITSGNQALRVSMWNVSQGDGVTSFDRPVALWIKAQDFWGVDDSRFDTFQAVRANPQDYSISIDVTFLADELPDTYADTGPYTRLGFFTSNAGAFNEGPADVLQGPAVLNLNNGDDDMDGLVNFTDPDYIDPGNPVGLPGEGVAGVIQRRYVFPASATTWPAADLADPPTAGLRHAAGGIGDAYMFGFVFNGNWTLTTPTTQSGIYDGQYGDPQSYVQTHASFIVDNIRFVEALPLAHADFNMDGDLDVEDWQILIANLNSLTANTFGQGDIGGFSGDPAPPSISPGVVNWEDLSHFEKIWDRFNGGAGSFQRFLAGVPEPTSAVLVLMGVAGLMFRRSRRKSPFAAVLVASAIAFWTSSASAALTDVQLFSFENGSFPDAFQRWQPVQNGEVDNATLALSTIGVTHGTQSLAITQTAATTPPTFVNVAAVSIFGSETGLPDQQQAFIEALDTGIQHYVLELDLTYRDANIPPTSYIAASVSLSAGSVTNDTVSNLALAGDGSGAVPDQSFHLSIPLGIGTVDTADGVLTMPLQSSVAGSYNLTIGLDGDWSGSATAYIDNVHLRQVTMPAVLTLDINTVTGEGFIRNQPGANSGPGDVQLNYYEIRSRYPTNTADFNGDGTVNAADYTVWRDNLGLMDTADQNEGDANDDGDVTRDDYDLWKAAYGLPSGVDGDSLNVAGWQNGNLDFKNTDAVDGPDPMSVAGDSDLEGWDASGSPSSTVVSEAYLLGSSTWTSSPVESLSIGNVYTPGMPQNVQFLYREVYRPDFLRQGIVTYFTPGGGGIAAPEPGTLILVAAVLPLAAGLRRRGNIRAV